MVQRVPTRRSVDNWLGEISLGVYTLTIRELTVLLAEDRNLWRLVRTLGRRVLNRGQEELNLYITMMEMELDEEKVIQLYIIDKGERYRHEDSTREGFIDELFRNERAIEVKKTLYTEQGEVEEDAENWVKEVVELLILFMMKDTMGVEDVDNYLRTTIKIKQLLYKANTPYTLEIRNKLREEIQKDMYSGVFKEYILELLRKRKKSTLYWQIRTDRVGYGAKTRINDIESNYLQAIIYLEAMEKIMQEKEGSILLGG